MFEWRLHAFVLLSNHLFAETPEANRPAGMHPGIARNVWHAWRVR
jgi:hypothetical protein